MGTQENRGRYHGDTGEQGEVPWGTGGGNMGDRGRYHGDRVR